MATPAVTPQASLQDAPGGDQFLDDLFPADLGLDGLVDNNQPSGTPAPTPAATPQAEPAPSSHPFLRAGETVYNTAEEAERGIAHKDAIINKLRDALYHVTGSDPLGKPSPAPQEPVSYAQNPQAYFKDLEKAVVAQDPQAYFEAQQRLVQDTIAPYAPILQDIALTRAIESVAKDIPEFRQFKVSEDYKNVLQENRKLSDAIELAESDFRFREDLPDLYRMAYAWGQYRKLPDLLRQAAPQVPPTPQARPTLAPAALTPGAPVANPDMSTSEGRKAILNAGRARGLDKLSW